MDECEASMSKLEGPLLGEKQITLRFFSRNSSFIEALLLSLCRLVSLEVKLWNSCGGFSSTAQASMSKSNFNRRTLHAKLNSGLRDTEMKLGIYSFQVFQSETIRCEESRKYTATWCLLEFETNTSRRITESERQCIFC